MAHRHWSKFTTKLQQNCHLSLRLFSPYIPCETKHGQFVHNSSNVYALKVMTIMWNIIADVQCLLLALRNALKQSCRWSIAWSVNLCWLLTIRFSQMLHQLIDVPHCMLPIKMFLHVSFSRCLQAPMHWYHGFHAARGESKCDVCCSNTVAARHLSSCWRLLLSMQRITRTQEHWAAATYDSGLHTRRSLPTDHTLVL